MKVMHELLRNPKGCKDTKFRPYKVKKRRLSRALTIGGTEFEYRCFSMENFMVESKIFLNQQLGQILSLGNSL